MKQKRPWKRTPKEKHEYLTCVRHPEREAVGTDIVLGLVFPHCYECRARLVKLDPDHRISQVRS